MTDRQDSSPENAPASAEQNLAPLEPLSTDATREQVADVLQPRKAPAELSTEDRIAVGDFHLEEGRFGHAHDWYVAADATDRLIALGDRLLDDGSIGLAGDAYAAAGQEIPQEKLDAYRTARQGW